ncbi:rod shape-determining protein MreC [Planomonospora alba]|uniref:Cell shape-determining protein MreC n=1 Tax=Planomonospora alba TaxID=161354 RepID=A0ABP6N6Y0_9ACTN
MRLAHRPRLVLGLLVIASAVLITIDVRSGAAALRGAAATAAGPADELLAAAGRPLSALAGGDARERVRELEEQNTRLAAELWAERAARRRAAGRDAIRAAAPHRGLVTARVVALGGHRGYGASATLDAGTRDGVRPDMPVVTADGLVGRVIEAGPGVCTVLLAVDAASSVGARVAGSGEIGVVTGTGAAGDGLLRLRLLDADAPLRAGQRVETFGSSGTRPYPPGVPIGTVVKVDPATDPLTRTALVRPAVRFTALDVVGVVTATASGEAGRAD